MTVEWDYRHVLSHPALSLYLNSLKETYNVHTYIELIKCSKNMSI